MRWRSHESDGAYASENKSAAMIIEVTVALSACPPTTKNFERMSNKPDIQETREIDTSFISCFVLCALCFVLGAWCLAKYKVLSTKHQIPRPLTSSFPYRDG